MQRQAFLPKLGETAGGHRYSAATQGRGFGDHLDGPLGAHQGKYRVDGRADGTEARDGRAVIDLVTVGVDQVHLATRFEHREHGVVGHTEVLARADDGNRDRVDKSR